MDCAPARLTNTEHFGFYDIGDEIILQHCTNRYCTGNLTAMADAIMEYKKCLRDTGIVRPQSHFWLLSAQRREGKEGETRGEWGGDGLPLA
jgi:hypothetical protein